MAEGMPPVGALPDAEDTRSMLLDLRRRLAAGEDIGNHVPDVRQALGAMRASVAGLRRLLNGRDRRPASNPDVTALAKRVLAQAEWNVACAEELLWLIGESDRIPRDAVSSRRR